MEPSPRGPGGRVGFHNFKKAVYEVATVDYFSPCHLKQDIYAYIFAEMQKCLILIMLLEFVCVP